MERAPAWRRTAVPPGEPRPRSIPASRAINRPSSQHNTQQAATGYFSHLLSYDPRLPCWRCQPSAACRAADAGGREPLPAPQATQGVRRACLNARPCVFICGPLWSTKHGVCIARYRPGAVPSPPHPVPVAVRAHRPQRRARIAGRAHVHSRVLRHGCRACLRAVFVGRLVVRSGVRTARILFR